MVRSSRFWIIPRHSEAAGNRKYVHKSAVHLGNQFAWFNFNQFLVIQWYHILFGLSAIQFYWKRNVGEFQANDSDTSWNVLAFSTSCLCIYYLFHLYMEYGECSEIYPRDTLEYFISIRNTVITSSVSSPRLVVTRKTKVCVFSMCPIFSGKCNLISIVKVKIPAVKQVLYPYF